MDQNGLFPFISLGLIDRCACIVFSSSSGMMPSPSIGADETEMTYMTWIWYILECSILHILIQ